MGFAGRRTAAGRAGVCSLPRAWAAGPSSEPEPQPRVRRRLGRGSNGRNGEQGIPVGSRGRAGRVAGSSIRGAQVAMLIGERQHPRSWPQARPAAPLPWAPDRPSARGRRRSPPHTRHKCARERRRPQKHRRARHPSEPHRALVDLHGAPSQGCRGLQARFILLLNAAPLESGETGGGSVGAALVPTGLIQLGARAPRPPPRSAAAASRCVSVSLRVVCDFFFPPESLAVEETLSQLCAELQVIGELRPGA